MTYQLIQQNGVTIVDALPAQTVIANERDAIDWVAICGENFSQCLLLNTANLTPDFFRLKSGVAGAILLKFVIYRLKVAAVLSPDLINQGKFQDFVLETNRGRDFRVFYDRQKALEWLSKDG